jgi:hypothetical protein
VKIAVVVFMIEVRVWPMLLKDVLQFLIDIAGNCGDYLGSQVQNDVSC